MINFLVSLLLVTFTVIDLYGFISHSDYMFGCMGVIHFEFIDPCFELIGSFIIGLLPLLVITYIFIKVAQRRGIRWRLIILRTSFLFSAFSAAINIADIRFLWPYLLVSVGLLFVSIFLLFVQRNRQELN